MRRARASLIASVVIGLLAVTTAGVSTYAWFKANSAATIDTDDDYTEITVATPDPINVSNTQVYMYRGTDVASKTCPTHYTLVSNAAARTFSNFKPGEKVTIAIKVTATSTINLGTMNLTYRGYSLSNRVIYGQTTKVINILSAIKVTAGANGTGTYPSMTEKVSPLTRGSEYTLASLTRVGSTASYYKQETVNGAVSNAAIGYTTAYFFYTVEFLNTSSTFYIEKDSTGNSNITTPTSDGGTRYFTGSNSGSSTCYEKLNFDVTAANITIG